MGLGRGDDRFKTGFQRVFLLFLWEDLITHGPVVRHGFRFRFLACLPPLRLVVPTGVVRLFWLLWVVS